MEKTVVGRCVRRTYSLLWNLTYVENTVSPRQGVCFAIQGPLQGIVPGGALTD